MWIKIVIMSFFIFSFLYAREIREITCTGPVPVAANIPIIEKKIQKKLMKDNPAWKCTVENFSLHSTNTGLNIMISGTGITNLDALADYDFDTVMLINTAVLDTRFLKNSKSLRVFSIVNEKNNFQSVDLSFLNGKKINNLFLSNVRVLDCTCIKDVGFKMLVFDNVENIDFDVFSNLRGLECFSAINMEIKDRKFLRDCPKIRSLQIGVGNSMKSEQK